MSYHAMLCCVMLCYVMPCQATMFKVVLYCGFRCLPPGRPESGGERGGGAKTVFCPLSLVQGERGFVPQGVCGYRKVNVVGKDGTTAGSVMLRVCYTVNY